MVNKRHLTLYLLRKLNTLLAKETIWSHIRIHGNIQIVDVERYASQRKGKGKEKL